MSTTHYVVSECTIDEALQFAPLCRRSYCIFHTKLS